MPGQEHNQARNIPEAEEEGADTDGDDEQVEEDDQLGVVALARQVGGTLQPGRRHVQAQRHLLHTGGWEFTQASRQRKSPLHFFGVGKRAFQCWGSVTLWCSAIPLTNGSGYESGSDSFLQLLKGSKNNFFSHFFHVKAQRHLLHGLGIYTSFETKKVAFTLFWGLVACFPVLGFRDILVRYL